MTALRELHDSRETGKSQRHRAEIEAGSRCDPSHAFSNEDSGTYASSPCFMHEFEFDDFFLTTPEVLRLLNELLEDQRAGVKAVSELWPRTFDATAREVLKDIVRDESRHCAMLTRHILRLRGTASKETGPFLAALRAAPSTSRIDLLKRRHHDIVRQVHSHRLRINDQLLRWDLEEMAAKHVLHSSLCEDLQTRVVRARKASDAPQKTSDAPRKASEMESNLRRNVAVYSIVHPAIFAGAVWCVAWMLLATWYFFNNGSDVTLALLGVTGFSMAFVGIPAVLWRVWSRNNQRPALRFSEWIHGEIEVGSGRIEARDAAVMVLLLPVASALGLTAISFVAFLAANGAL
jgi:hypothetical protein